jgi:hypothetical protein
MKIHEGRAILDLKSPYLLDSTKIKIEELLGYMERGSSIEAYKATEEVATSLHNVTYESILENMIAHHVSCSFADPVRVDTQIKQAKTDQELADFKKKFKVRGLYFAEDGFLGFLFHDGYAVMLQIGESDKKVNEEFGKTVPFFRDKDSGEWLGRECFGNRSLLWGTFQPGPLGKEFAEYLNERVNEMID